MNPTEVVCVAYVRCDQENHVEQVKSGIAAMRMPIWEPLANSTFLDGGATGLVPEILAAGAGSAEGDHSPVWVSEVRATSFPAKCRTEASPPSQSDPSPSV
jgi:hypothetical protein